jgi:hypothetical protein
MATYSKFHRLKINDFMDKTYLKLNKKMDSLTKEIEGRTLLGTQYTHHSLKHMLPQHCSTNKDVLLLINVTKV